LSYGPSSFSTTTNIDWNNLDWVDFALSHSPDSDFTFSFSLPAAVIDTVFMERTELTPGCGFLHLHDTNGDGFNDNCQDCGVSVYDGTDAVALEIGKNTKFDDVFHEVCLDACKCYTLECSSDGHAFETQFVLYGTAGPLAGGVGTQCGSTGARREVCIACDGSGSLAQSCSSDTDCNYSSCNGSCSDGQCTNGDKSCPARNPSITPSLTADIALATSSSDTTDLSLSFQYSDYTSLLATSNAFSYDSSTLTATHSMTTQKSHSYHGSSSPELHSLYPKEVRHPAVCLCHLLRPPCSRMC